MRFVIIIFVSLLTLSCANKTMGQTDRENKIVNLYEGTLTGAGAEGFEKGNIIIQSQEAWQSIVNKLNSVNEVTSQFNSTIDFSKNNVIIAVDRVRSTSGFSIKLSKAQEQKDMLELNVLTKGPGPTDMVATVITQPIHIILIHKTDKKIVFVEK
ncbi:protease complex subunit PrcB family protein [Tenacibaculum sp. 190524A05c]|uniref:protease complex subunit PrcB family protein n=1 Tax=Tenacibaculum platacis TaxID=3137852 RepID=UPI0031FAED57